MNQSQLAQEMEQLLRLRISRIRIKAKNIPENDPRCKELKACLLRTQSQLEEQYCSFQS